MNSTEKKLDALIDALGFDVERFCDIKRAYKCEDLQGNGEPKEYALPESIIDNSTYKLTKRKYNEKPTIHKIVRIYEKGEISSGEMIARINEQVWKEQ